MKKSDLEKQAKLKSESRKIVKEIINHGVTESQKIDIVYFLAMELENHEEAKEITNFLKKFKTKFNTDNQEGNIKIENQKPKVLIT